jgi:spermidine/putrescine transport system ATP-binding protein
VGDLSLDGIYKDFPSHRVVDGISFTIPQGCFYSLLGPSGCGKTTTLRMIGGFEEPDRGTIQLGGRTLNGLRPYQRPVTTVFQSYALFPHLTAAENIAFGLERKRDPDAARKVKAALDLVQLSAKADRLPTRMSGGERQRTALARALVVEPELLLLDEPLSALDPKLRQQMRLELKELQARIGITFLFVTHDQEEALSLSDQIAVMHKGRLAQIGTPQQIYLQPATRFVASFLGAVNWVGDVGVRPEATRISREAPGAGTRAREATVNSSMFLGDCLQVETRTLAGDHIIAQIAHGLGEFRRGDRVHVWWHPDDEMALPQ